MSEPDPTPLAPTATSPPSATAADAATVPFALDPTAASELPALPGFEVQGVLGRGGMGVVYLARQPGLDRLVAVKMILAGGHADVRERRRFQVEAEAVGRLRHPNIVQVHHVGEHDGLPFLVLEYVSGGPLSRRLAGQPQPAARAAAWVAALAGAMQAAHDAGVVHRDLKPANVLLDADDTPKVTDFGLAKKREADGPTATGAVMGTPSYMAPEQAEGRTDDVGPLADVYALGAILYECLTGRPPFRADTPLNTVRQVLTVEPVAPRLLNPAVPRDLETIALKCLAKEPGRRYASAQDLADDLGRFQRGEPIRARPVGVVERAWRWGQRNPVVAGLSAAVVGVLVLGVAVSLYYAGEATREAALKRGEADRANQAARKARLDRYLAQMNLAAIAFGTGERSRVRHLLAAGVPGPDEADLRGLEWNLLQRQSRGALQVLEQTGLGGYVLGWSADGRHLYFVRAANHFVAWDVARAAPAFETRLPSLPFALAVRPDGRQVALAGRRYLVFVDARTGRTVVEAPAGPDSPRGLAYRPDGGEVAAGSADFRARTHDPETGAERRVLAGHHAFLRGVGYVPGTDHVVSVDVYRWLIRRDPRAAEPVWKVQTEHGVATCLAVHPTRPLAAVGSNAGKVELRELERGGPVRTLEAASDLHAVCFSPDGTCVAAAGKDGVVRVWDVGRGDLLASLDGHESEVGALAWSPDGWRLASLSAGDGTVRVWSAATTALERTWASGVLPVGGVVLHPAGEGVLLVTGERAATLVDLAGPIRERPVPGYAGSLHDAEWSPDGRYLALMGMWSIEIRDGRGRRVVRRLDGHGNVLSGVRFLPDGRHLLSADNSGEVRLTDVESGALVASWRGKAIATRLVVSADGRLVALLADAVSVRRLPGFEPVLELPALPMPPGEAAFLRDGRLAVGDHDGVVRLHALPSGTVEATLMNKAARVHGLWAPTDGRRLVSQTEDGTLTIWDLDTNEAVRVVRGEWGPTPAAALDPSGRWAVRVRDGTAGVWDLRPLDAVAIVRREAVALVDHLASRCVDRADLLRRVRAQPALTDAVRAEAEALAARYEDDAEALAWQVFDRAVVPDRLPEAYADQLPRAIRTVRDLPDDPLALLARGTVELRLGRLDDARTSLAAAEKVFGRRPELPRAWLWRLQGLVAFKSNRRDEAQALADRAIALPAESSGGQRGVDLGGELSQLLGPP